jgi:ABC-type lipoprotein release transport system permease subunit
VSLILKLGYRNLWRNRRRTMLTMSAMAAATALVIFMLGIYDGMIWDMIDSATLDYHGHVKVTEPGYLERRRMQLTIPEDGLYEQLAADPSVPGATGRVRGFALLSAGEGEESHSQPAELLGIDPAQERTVTRLEEGVVQGEFIDSADTHGILLGTGLARRLEASVGDEIVAMGQAADGSIAADLFTVWGIIETGEPVRDASLAITGRRTVQVMFVLEGRLHEWALRLDRPLDATGWAERFNASHTGVEAAGWIQFLPLMGQLLDLWGVSKFIFAVIFYFAVILVAANTMYMAFFERIREFAVMEALGLKSIRLSSLIIYEGFLLSGIAGLVGGVIGIAASLYFSTHVIDLSSFFDPISYAGGAIQPRLRVYPALNNILYPILLIVGLGLLVALFPAWKLRRLKPVDALKEV